MSASDGAVDPAMATHALLSKARWRVTEPHCGQLTSKELIADEAIERLDLYRPDGGICANQAILIVVSSGGAIARR